MELTLQLVTVTSTLTSLRCMSLARSIANARSAGGSIVVHASNHVGARCCLACNTYYRLGSARLGSARPILWHSCIELFLVWAFYRGQLGLLCASWGYASAHGKRHLLRKWGNGLGKRLPGFALLTYILKSKVKVKVTRHKTVPERVLLNSCECWFLPARPPEGSLKTLPCFHYCDKRTEAN